MCWSRLLDGCFDEETLQQEDCKSSTCYRAGRVISLFKRCLWFDLTEQAVYCARRSARVNCCLVRGHVFHSPIFFSFLLSLPAQYLLQLCLDAVRERLLARSKSADQARQDFSSLWAGLLVTSRRASLPLVSALEPQCTW